MTSNPTDQLQQHNAIALTHSLISWIRQGKNLREFLKIHHHSDRTIRQAIALANCQEEYRQAILHKKRTKEKITRAQAKKREKRRSDTLDYRDINKACDEFFRKRGLPATHPFNSPQPKNKNE